MKKLQLLGSNCATKGQESKARSMGGSKTDVLNALKKRNQFFPLNKLERHLGHFSGFSVEGCFL